MTTRHRPAHRTRRSVRRPLKALALSAGLGGFLASMAGAGSPASADIVAGTASQLAAALTAANTTMTGGTYVANTSAASNGVGTTPLGGFPTAGPTYTILTTGFASSADDPNVNVPDLPGAQDDVSTSLGGATVRGNTSYDVSVLRVGVNVPPTANCLSFDFQFLSEEFPEFVGSSFNDAFVAELDTSTWRTNGTAIVAPDNFAFDTSHDAISINSSGVTGMSTSNAAGTTYDGASQLLTAAHQVTPGAHDVYFSIFDQGDNEVDSAVFLDNLHVGHVDDPAQGCQPGAQLKGVDVTLTPDSASLTLGQTHTVTAQLTETGTTEASVGASVVFEVDGANHATGTGTTDENGQASFSYTGTNLGDDTITACNDRDGDGSCGSDEAVATVAATWVGAAPVNDVAGPFSGSEGNPITVAGT